MFSRKEIITSLAIASLALQTLPAALAQTTVLSGRVHSSAAMPQLVREIPVSQTLPSSVRETVSVPVRQTVTVNTQRRPHLYSSTTQTKTVYVEKPVYREVYVRDNRTYFQRHPKVKAVSIGAGVGAGAGALTGLITGAGALRGGVIGAGTGAGVGLVRSSNTLKRHPIARDTATGALSGLGIGAASGRGGRRALEGAGIGTAVGLGVGLFKHLR